MRIFSRKPSRERIQPTGVVWDIAAHNGWGNRISWRDFQTRRLDGHTTPLVHVGDEIRSPMQSGEQARFLVTEIEYAQNVRDMWWATVEDIGYVDDDSPPVSRFGVFGNLIA